MVHVAETRIDSGVAAMIAGSVPLQIVVWRALAGERVPRATVLAAAVGLVGLALVVGPGGVERRLGRGRSARDARRVALVVSRLVRLAAARAARRPVRRDGLRDARRRARARGRGARRRRGGRSSARTHSSPGPVAAWATSRSWDRSSASARTPGFSKQRADLAGRDAPVREPARRRRARGAAPR